VALQEIEEIRARVRPDQADSVRKIRIINDWSRSEVVRRALDLYFAHFNDRFEERECLALWVKREDQSDER
jgi:hypothetical protein